MAKIKDRAEKDKLLMAAAIAILFLTLIRDWTFHSWLVLAAIILLLLAWYLKK